VLYGAMSLQASVNWNSLFVVCCRHVVVSSRNEKSQLLTPPLAIEM
jgi:hypothetical protein